MGAVSVLEMNEQNTTIGNCPRCFQGFGGKSICFRWDAAPVKHEKDRKIVGDYDVYRQSIRLQEKMNSGSLWQCEYCTAYWFLTPDEKWMHFLEDECLDIVRAWDNFDYELPAYCLESISLLGATLRDESYCGKRAVEIPCQVILRDGTIVDPALVSFSITPPLQTFGKGVYLLSEASEVSASAYALPKEIRFATRLAEWICKSPEPVFAHSGKGTIFELAYEQDFFSHPTVRAEELLLANSGVLSEEKYEQPMPAQFCAKLSSQIEQTLLSPFLEFKANRKT